MFYSFDIFDTLITRKTATPTGIFSIMQDRLLNSLQYAGINQYIRENFYDLRIHAEKLARAQYQRNGCDEVTLAEIYEGIATTGCFSEADINVLMNLELKIEQENIVGIRENILRIKNILLSGNRVVLISDMYMNAIQIRTLLEAVDCVFEKVEIYVSSDYKLGKHSGQLYLKVKELEKISFNEWFHFGDNLHSDVNIPQKLGIHAEHYVYESLLPIEKNQIKEHFTDRYTQISIGLARNIRLNQMLKQSAAIGCSVGGAILCPYVQWILEESQRRNIKRLYFIARDGYILKFIADILIQKMNIAIKTYYIYGSRRAWRMPAYDGETITLKNLIGWSYTEHIKSLNDLAKLLKISKDDLMQFLPIEYKEENGNREISFFELCFCVEQLDQSKQFKEFFVKLMKSERTLVEKYLRQEINVTDPNFAFVDLGGGGFTQSCMTELLKAFSQFPVRTFFFKMDRINLMKNNVCYNFLPSCLKNGLVIEMLCRASHGQTEGYIERDNKVFPVFKDNEGQQIISHGYDEYMNGIRFFAEEYASLIKCEKISVSTNLLLNYMSFIMESPDKSLYEFVAGMPNSVTGREKKVKAFAPKVTKQNIRDIFLFHLGEPIGRYYEGTDFNFALLYASEARKRKITFYQTKRNELIARFENIMHRSLFKENNAFTYIEEIPRFLLGRRIIVYGAGKFGKRLYQFLKGKYREQDIIWLDKDYELLIGCGFPVSGNMDKITSLTYDKIVVAVLNKNIFYSIREEFITRGVLKTKIIWAAYEGVMDFKRPILSYLDV